MPVGVDRYPSDPGDPMKVLEERLRLLEAKVAEQDRRNPLNNGVFSGTLRNVDAAGNTVLSLGPDGLRMYDDTGALRAVVGLTTLAHYGLLVLDADGITQRVQADERGMLMPYLSAPFVDADTDFKVVTSATFVATHRAVIEQISHQGLYCQVVATAPAGTTGEVRLRNVATGTFTDVVAVPDGGQAAQQFRWLHGTTLSAGPATFEVQARRVSGAGDVNVYCPPGLWMTDPTICVSDGVA